MRMDDEIYNNESWSIKKSSHTGFQQQENVTNFSKRSITTIFNITKKAGILKINFNKQSILST